MAGPMNNNEMQKLSDKMKVEMTKMQKANERLSSDFTSSQENI